MITIIFLLGMFLAALFAIFSYGNLGVHPSPEKIWVDCLHGKKGRGFD